MSSPSSPSSPAGALPPSPLNKDATGDLPPPKATKKPKFDSQYKGLCTIAGCGTKVMSVKLNITSNILTFGMLLSDRDRKHHCRHCLRRVCSKHFTKTESGYKICTECQESGVEVDPDAGEVREDDDDEEEEDEEEEDTKEGGKKS